LNWARSIRWRFLVCDDRVLLRFVLPPFIVGHGACHSDESPDEGGEQKLHEPILAPQSALAHPRQSEPGPRGICLLVRMAPESPQTEEQ
jgi:hypothetical protein